MADEFSLTLPYLNALAAKQSTPGGGAAAAITGSQAAALAAMVAAFSDETLEALRLESEATVKRFVELANEDAKGFDALMAAYRDRKHPDRKQHIQAGLLTAMAAPRAMIAEATRLSERLPTLIADGNANLITDTAMVAILLRATIESAILNVQINLKSVRNDSVIQEVEQELTAAAETINVLEQAAQQARDAL